MDIGEHGLLFHPCLSLILFDWSERGEEYTKYRGKEGESKHRAILVQTHLFPSLHLEFLSLSPAVLILELPWTPGQFI